MTVHAPFRFAPINRWVYFPDWAALASHDVPFKDGLSGEIELEIRAETPLLVGGRRRAPEKDQAGEVWPFQLPDGRYAIPGSTLQGMTRSILEIATFGKLGDWIDDRRFGVRDLSPATAPFYQERLNKPRAGASRVYDPQVKTGWLRRTPQGAFEFKKCEMARVDYSDLAAITPTPSLPLPRRLNPPFMNTVAGNAAFDAAYDAARTAILAMTDEWHHESEVRQRYGWMGPAGPKTLYVEALPSLKAHATYFDKGPGRWKKRIQIEYRNATAATGAGRVAENGYLVLTGVTADPPADGTKPVKHFEFFFYDSGATLTLPTSFEKRFEEFLALHAPEDGRQISDNWLFYQDTGYPGQPPFKNNGWMPIFYLEDKAGDIDCFGLAYMFKIAHSHSTHDLIGNSSSDHFEDNRADFASLIFGEKANEKLKRGLKRRAAFDCAIASLPNGSEVQTGSHNAVLLSPKPSYYPIYVRQPGATSGVLPPAGNKPVPYATYTPLAGGPLDQHRRPELSGVKVWPAKTRNFAVQGQPAKFRLEPIEEALASNLKIQAQLSALPRKTVFSKVTLRFHNLRRIELGAILWALSFGNEKAWNGANFDHLTKRHRLGMGKPFQMGQVIIRILGLNATANDGSNSNPDVGSVVEDFTKHMKDAYGSSGDAGEWSGSVQVKTLLKSAEPEQNATTELTYMSLGDGGHAPSNTYIGARRQGHVLQSYVGDAGEAPQQLNAPGGPEGPPPPINGPQPGGGGTSSGPVSPVSVNVEPPKAGPPGVGARIRLNARGSLGTITAEPNDPKQPKWLILLDGAKKPQRYLASTFTVIG